MRRWVHFLLDFLPCLLSALGGEKLKELHVDVALVQECLGVAQIRQRSALCLRRN